MKKTTKKRGFTIVELVIVIAVIAILAAVLIPTFSNIINKANISADVQLCRNLNTVLANANALGRIPGSVYDVLYLENEAGYILENLNPTAEGFYYAWDQANNKIVYLMSDLETVYYPQDYTVVPGNCWVTVGSAEEAAVIAGKGYNLALERDITEEIVLSNVVSINTLGFKCANVTMSSGSKDVTTAYLIGQFGNTNITAGATSIVTSGTATSLNVSGSAATSVTIGGYVNNYSATGGTNSVVSSAGLVNTVASSNTASITNNGVVVNKGNSVVTGGSSSVTGNVVAAATKEDLDSIRVQVASGARSFEGETLALSADINMNGIAFTPLANVSREGIDANSKAVFKGTFDGKGYSIKNFSTSGFSIAGLNAGTNSSTPFFTEAKVKYNEAVYGLFGVTYNATIKNLNVTCDIDMVLDNANHYVGDSVGGIVGCAFGTITFENCTVSGSVKGYDGVGGFLGRLKGTSATFINCTNNATVTGVRKTGGFIGSSYKGNYTITYTNCVNNGDVICLGIEKDMELVAWNAKNGVPSTKVEGTVEAKNYTGYYTASASNGEYASAEFVPGSKLPNNKVIVNSFTNNGKIMVGSVEVGNGTYRSGVDDKCHH